MAKRRPIDASHETAVATPRLGTNIAWNYISGFTSMFGLLLLYPLAIHVVGSETYGLWVLTSGSIQLLTMTDFGLGSGVVRLLTEMDQDNPASLESRRRFVSTSILVFLLLAVVLTLAYCAVFPLYLSSLEILPQDREAVVPMVLLAGLTLLVSVLGRAFNSVLWAEDRQDIERKAAVVALILRALGYGALLHLDGGLMGIVLVECLTLMVPPAVCAVAVQRRYSRPQFTRRSWSEYGKPLLKMSSVLSIGSLSQIGVQQLPLFIVGPTLGLNAATAFGALMRVYQSCRLLISWSSLPFTYPIKRSGRPHVTGQIKACLHLSLTMGLLMAVPLSALPNELLELWLGPEFLFAAGALAVVALGVLAEALAQPPDLVLTLRGSPMTASLLNLMTLALTVPTVFWAAESGTLETVMLATVGPSFLVAWLQVALASRVEPLRVTACERWRWVRMVLVAGAAIGGFTALGQVLQPLPTVLVCAGALGVVALRTLIKVRDVTG